jgi:DNA-binding LacI/PurR family transcriptional regulator
MSTIGVITPYVSKWFFGQVIAGIQDELNTTVFDMILYVDEEGKLFETLPMRRRVDAVLILTLPPDHPDVSSVAKMGIPVGTLGDTVEGFSSVGIDDVAGAKAAVNHLIGLGHRRIAMVTMDDQRQVHYSAPRHRRLGYEEALREAGLELDPTLIVGGGAGADGGEQAAGEILALAQRPTAIFVQSDELAFGVLHVLRRAGLRCPEDISVIGFDDAELSAMMDLTTVSQPAREQGRALAKQVLAQVREGAPPRSSRLPTRLVIRGTTAPAPGGGER